MPNDDMISRAALLDAIDDERKKLIEWGSLGAEHVVVHHARRLIEEAPAVDATPVVHGRWEFCGDDHLVCGVCGARYYKGWLIQSYCTGPGSDQMDGFWHCPHCGALLDGGEEIQPTVDAAQVVRCEDCTLRGTEKCLWYDADDDPDCCSHDDTMNGGDDA